MRARSAARLVAISTFAVVFGALEPASEHSFAVHMSQHMALMVILAPLIVLGWLPRQAPRIFGSVEFALVAVAAQTTALALWHIPGVFDAAEAHAPLHVAEHVTLLVTAVAAWWVILASPAGTAIRFAACAGAAAPMLLLGMVLTFAPSPWYSAYPHLTDQQVGGAIMWGPAGLAYVVAAGWLVARALVDDERLTATRSGT